MVHYKFTYTHLKHWKNAVPKIRVPKSSPYRWTNNKTQYGMARPGTTHFIITPGKDYSECLMKAKEEAKFNEDQLLGALQVVAQNWVN